MKNKIRIEPRTNIKSERIVQINKLSLHLFRNSKLANLTAVRRLVAHIRASRGTELSRRNITSGVSLPLQHRRWKWRAKVSPRDFFKRVEIPRLRARAYKDILGGNFFFLPLNLYCRGGVRVFNCNLWRLTRGQLAKVR